MQLSYIILAHKNPQQLGRLINRLNQPWVTFYIHVDRNVNIKPFLAIRKSFYNVTFLEEDERCEGVWGGIGIVKATLNAMHKVNNTNQGGYCILLTGQDYPLAPNQKILEFFHKNSGKGFISIVQTPENWDKHYLDRIKKYKIHKSKKRGHFLHLSSIFEKDFYKYETLGKLNFLRKSGRSKEIHQIFKKRKFPNYITPYGGGVYFALPTEIIRKILEFHKEHPDFLEWNKYTLCADEVFFHSIIMNIKKKEDFELETSLTYVNWERPSGPLPVTFEKTDFKELKNASENFLWARKFDNKQDEEILNQIDKKLLI